MSAFGARLSGRPGSPHTPLDDLYRTRRDDLHSRPSRPLSERVGPSGLRSISPAVSASYPSTVSERGSRPSLPPSAPTSAPPLPRPREGQDYSACPSPWVPSPAQPRWAGERSAPPEGYQRSRREEEEGRSWTEYYRRREQREDAWGGRTGDAYWRAEDRPHRYDYDRRSSPGLRAERPRQPLPTPRFPLPSRPDERSPPPTTQPAVHEVRAGERSGESRWPDIVHTTDTHRPDQPPTPPPSAPGDSGANRHEAMTTTPSERRVAVLPMRTPDVHDVAVYVKQEIIVKEEVIEEEGGDAVDYRDEPRGDLALLHPTPPETPEAPLRQEHADHPDDSSQNEQHDATDSTAIQAQAPDTFSDDVVRSGLAQQPLLEADVYGVNPNDGDRETNQPGAQNNGASPVVRPIKPAEEATHIDYQDFKHFFEVVLPANYSNMTKRAKKAWRAMQLANAVCRDQRGEPTRLVRLGRGGRRGSRKVRIYWTPIQNAGVNAGRALPNLATKKRLGSLAQMSVPPTTSAQSEGPRSPSPIDLSPHNSQTQDVSVQPVEAQASGAAEKGIPIFGPLPNLRRTTNGEINMRSIRKEDVPYASYVPLPEEYLESETPTTASRHKIWTRTQRAIAERRNAKGEPTRLVKTLGRLGDSFVLLWRPLDKNDDMIDVFSGDIVPTQPPKQPRVSRKRKRDSQCSPSTVGTDRCTTEGLAQRDSSPSLDTEITTTTTDATAALLDTDESDEDVLLESDGSDEDIPLFEIRKPIVRRKRVIQTHSPSRSPSPVRSESTVSVHETSSRHQTPTQVAVGAPGAANTIAEGSGDTQPPVPPPPSGVHVPVQPDPRDAATVPRTEDDHPLQGLQSALCDALDSIDRWTEMLERHPERRLIIEKQLKRTQDEVFRLDAQILNAKSALPRVE